MWITLSALVLPSVIARHVQLPLLDEVDGRRAQHDDGSTDGGPLSSTAKGTTPKLSESWFDQAREGLKKSYKQSKWGRFQYKRRGYPTTP